ncbi:MAG TPA: type I DNA topoisomerase [Acidobacteriota bacterium]|nr:type I DNA topoisomerase [Acidobacteriota bacterium]
MSKSMVVVESPAKAKTIGKYLGNDFVVKASSGHIKDLPKKTLGVDIENDFAPTYKVIPGKEKIVDDLRKTAKNVAAIYLAADPDREGEAICQHLAEILHTSKKSSQKIYRVLFNEITKSAILHAFEHPGQIDEHKVEAQQARRILDRLVGYKISPLLWEKVRRGLSAGRVQSVALRLIVDREREIQAFRSEEYWNFIANLSGSAPPPFDARAIKLDGKKFHVPHQQLAEEIQAHLGQVPFRVVSVIRKEKRKNPVPPFTTSKLQQEAARKLRFTVKRTMIIAQRLYEGIEIGDEGSVGLITYMRTDSTRVADSALQEVRGYIDQRYGGPYLPEKAARFKSQKGAQEAHEAVRPTLVDRTPESLKPHLDRDAYRLYDLIWKRFVASQMEPALFDQTEIDIEAGRVLFKASGAVLKFDGFLKVYQEGRDEEPASDTDEEEKLLQLPPLREGELLQVNKLTKEQKFTQPPPRYSEATLVKALEEKGIGRPSTYAQIVNVIQNRDYANKEEGKFVPTETGMVVTDLLVEHFKEIFDYQYTARMEAALDEIEEGKEDWIDTLNEFYKEFQKELKRAQSQMQNLKAEEIETDEVCEKCGSKMVIKWGRFGRFLACSNYPECKNTKELPKENGSEAKPAAAEIESEPCEKCGKPMILKKGRFGEFLACSGYPECKNTRKIISRGGEREVKADIPTGEKCPKCGQVLVVKHGRFGEFTACSNYPECRYIKQESTGVICPKCGKFDLVARKSKRGKVFYGCGSYPDCDFVLWYKPVPIPCPRCGEKFLLERQTKKEGLIRYCQKEGCKYKEVIEEAAAMA